MVKHAPKSLFETFNLPKEFFSMIILLIYSPIPAPLLACFVEKYGSKIFSMGLVFIPPPLSQTFIMIELSSS